MEELNDAFVQQAVQKAKRDAFRKDAARRLRSVAQGIAQEAKSRGFGSYAVTPSFVYEDRGKQAGLWPMRLAQMLLTNRELARKSNAFLMKAVCNELRIKPYAASKMSKPPSPRQKAKLVQLLQAYGFTDPRFESMTDVKALIAGGGASSTRRTSQTVEVGFDGADRLILGTKTYPIEARRAQPSGDPLLDHCARILDTRTSLAVVMEILGVSREQGRSMFEAGVKFAAEQAAAKNARAIEAQHAEALDDLFEVDQRV